MKISKYNFEFLLKVIERDKAILIGNYDTIKSISKILYKCNCGNELTKTFYNMDKNGGAFCKKCTIIKAKDKYIKTNLITYGREYASSTKEFREKVKKTVLEKYGVENVSKNNEVKNKKDKTNIKIYGHKCSIMNESIKEKTKQTNLEKYGTIYPKNINRNNEEIKIKNIKKYGVSCTLQSKEAKEKTKETNIKRYGVEFPQQSIIIQDKIQKNCKKFKEYKMPSGIIRKVQGYEPFALDELTKIYSENEIKSDRKDVPRIEYIYNNFKKYYFPDIYIPSKRLIIEVKSDYTYNITTDIRELKKNACLDNGFNYEFWIYNSKTKEKIMI